MKEMIVIRALPSGEWEIQVQTKKAGQQIRRGKRCKV